MIRWMLLLFCSSILLFVHSLTPPYPIHLHGATTSIQDFEYFNYPPLFFANQIRCPFASSVPTPSTWTELSNFCLQNGDLWKCRYSHLLVPKHDYYSLYFSLFPSNNVGPEDRFDVSFINYTYFLSNTPPQNVPIEQIVPYSQYTTYDLCNFWNYFFTSFLQRNNQSISSQEQFFYTQLEQLSCKDYIMDSPFGLYPTANWSFLYAMQYDESNPSVMRMQAVHKAKLFFCSWCAIEESSSNLAQLDSYLVNQTMQWSNISMYLHEGIMGNRFCIPHIPYRYIYYDYPKETCYCSQYNKYIDTSYPCEHISSIVPLFTIFSVFNGVRLLVSLFISGFILFVVCFPEWIGIMVVHHCAKWRHFFSWKMLAVYALFVASLFELVENIALVLESIFQDLFWISSFSYVSWFVSRLLLWFGLCCIVAQWDSIAREETHTNNYLAQFAASQQEHHWIYKHKQFLNCCKLALISIVLIVMLLLIGGIIFSETLLYVVVGPKQIQNIHIGFSIAGDTFLSISYFILLIVYPILGIFVCKLLYNLGLKKLLIKFAVYISVIEIVGILYWMFHFISLLSYSTFEIPWISFIVNSMEYILIKIQYIATMILLMEGSLLIYFCKKRKTPSTTTNNTDSLPWTDDTVPNLTIDSALVSQASGIIQETEEESQQKPRRKSGIKRSQLFIADMDTDAESHSSTTSYQLDES